MNSSSPALPRGSQVASSALPRSNPTPPKLMPTIATNQVDVKEDEGDTKIKILNPLKLNEKAMVRVHLHMLCKTQPGVCMHIMY